MRHVKSTGHRTSHTKKAKKTHKRPKHRKKG